MLSLWPYKSRLLTPKAKASWLVRDISIKHKGFVSVFVIFRLTLDFHSDPFFCIQSYAFIPHAMPKKAEFNKYFIVLGCTTMIYGLKFVNTPSNQNKNTKFAV